MRFTRWCSLILATVWILLSLTLLGGASQEKLPSFENAGGEYILRPGVALFLMLIAIVAVSLLGASWAARKAGDRARERNQVRWGVALTTVTILGYLVFSLLQSGAATDADCHWDFYNQDRTDSIWDCEDVQGMLTSTSEAFLALALISFVLLVIVLLAARIGQRVSEPVVPGPQPGPAEPRQGGGDVVDRLRELGQMHADGRLSDEEFESAKRLLLERPDSN